VSFFFFRQIFHNLFDIVDNNFIGLGVKLMKSYEINKKTLALCSLGSRTRVYEEDDAFIVDKLTSEIIDDSCSYYGSSLSGRQKGTENLIGISYKSPIIVEESNNIIFFPTTSPRQKKCTWLKSSSIERYYYRNNCLIVEFKNGSKIPVDTTYGVIDNQIMRSSRLESVLNSRKKEKKL
jgi:competence protein ComK